ncbi:MAG: biopolymer transporter ExbD, partial [Bdellovibrionales bacterium]|nr:biopolymer transporter ExbD [Bdellovibrionales bacterium]NQZ18917.1 biopolymer transporter ExbD [Bdellovibrionales bacterium]
DINVVPLVDIILVVLIIFMVTAPLVLKPTIDVNLPQATSGEAKKSEAKNLEVVIAKDGQLFLNGEKVNIEELKVQVSQAAETSSDSSAVLTADKDVTLETLTSVIDVIKTSGLKKVGFSIQKK